MSENKVSCYEFGDFCLDIKNCQLSQNGASISLTQKSFDILYFLIKNRGRILKKSELMDSLWQESFVEESNLTQQIYMLRKALKQNGNGNIYIETIPKNGYRFIADVKEIQRNNIPTDISENGDNKEVYEELNKTFDENSLLSKTPNNSQHFSVQPDNLNSTNKRKAYGLLVITGIMILLLGTVGLFYFANDLKAKDSKNVVRNKSIAVLPFQQISEEKDVKLGLGIADVLIARLANIEEIDVRPTISIIRFSKEETSDLFEVGKKLGVDYVISGTIQRDKEIVRINAQLYDVESKHQIWMEKFDEKYSDIFTLQDKISEKIARRLSQGMRENYAFLPYRQYTQNAEAYKAYSKGLTSWSKHTEKGFEDAINQFKKAIDKDPNFVLAHAYLADTYAHTSHIRHLFSAGEARAKGEESAKKALKLDPNSAEALAALALIYANSGRQSESLGLMKKAVELSPKDAHIRHRISWMYANKNNIEQSVKEMRLAKTLDPQSAYLNLFLAEILILARQPDEAIANLEKALEIEPNMLTAKWHLVKASEQKGMYDEAENMLKELMQKAENNKALRLALSRIYAKNNKHDEANRLLKQVLSEGNNENLKNLIAYSYIALGEEEKAIENLKPVIENVGDSIFRIKYEPNIDPIRNNPKFAKLLKAKEDEQNW